MPDRIEPAPSGRAKCRGCQQKIEKGDLRFGEAIPNPFGDGETLHYYHPRCAALKRPENFENLLQQTEVDVPNRDELAGLAHLGVEHPRLARFARAERAPSGRARCQGCRKLIEKDVLRLVLERIEEGMVSGSGFVHVECAKIYAGTTESVLARVEDMSPKLDAADFDEVKRLLEEAQAKPAPDAADASSDD